MTTSQAIERVPASSVALQVFGPERLQVLKDVIAKGCTDEELDVFALVCQRTKLDPFARPPQIYAIKRWDSKLRREVLTPQASVDSFRLVAARTREYQGQVGPFWCGPDGQWKEVWLADEPPTAARVGVYRKGFREPIWSVATWKASAQSFNGKLGDFWERMPAKMLAKVAETDALKRAFPNDTEGVELALIEEEIRAGAAAHASRYREVFGDEQNGTAYDLERRALHDGRTVDTDTGEVLEESFTPSREREVEDQPRGKAPGGTSEAAVTHKDDPLWREWLQAEAKVRKAGLQLDTAQVHLPISQESLRASIADLNEALKSADGEEAF